MLQRGAGPLRASLPVLTPHVHLRGLPPSGFYGVRRGTHLDLQIELGDECMPARHARAFRAVVPVPVTARGLLELPLLAAARAVLPGGYCGPHAALRYVVARIHHSRTVARATDKTADRGGACRTFGAWGAGGRDPGVSRSEACRRRPA